MKIYIGADHRGYKYKMKICRLLEKRGVKVVDVGVHEEGVPCDYPRVAYEVATGVVKTRSKGVLICMSGIGQVIAANKVRGAYAALCYNVKSAALSRRHNNANILVIGAQSIREKDLGRIVKIWLTTDFEGGRHLRRTNQIKKIEKGLKP